MRYAFISDLHANLQAWRAVHLDIRSSRADYIICLGDIIGYGPSPGDLLNDVHAHVDAFVLGNHDAVVSGQLDDASFNPEARELIRWTASQLNPKAASFLASFPLTLVGDGFRCTHGDFAHPENFEYVLNPEDALPSWNAVDAPLLLAGHTHEPAFFLIGPSGIPRQAEPQDFEIEPGKRYFVNAGSVGYPRDGDPRASYCLYDTEARAVFWRRVPFDLDSYRTTVVQAGLDPERCQLLRNDLLAGMEPIRELLDFTPPTTPEKAVQNAIPTQDITRLKQSIRRWKLLFLFSAALVLAVLVAALWFWRAQADYSMIIGPPLKTVDGTHYPPKSNILPVLNATSATGDRVDGWRIYLGDSRLQRLDVIAPQGDGLCLQLASQVNGTQMALSAPAIHVTPGQSWSMSGLLQKGDHFTGTALMAMILVRQGAKGDETNENFYVKEPFLPRADGWMKVHQTFRVPAGGKTIQFQIRGMFRGILRAKGMSLECANPKPAGPQNRISNPE